MPLQLPIPTAVVSNERSCVATNILAPIGGELSATAEFQREITYADGRKEKVADGSISFTQAELLAMEGAAAFKAAFTAAAHAKRAGYDPQPS